MKSSPFKIAAFVLAVTAGAAGTAQAQWYSSVDSAAYAKPSNRNAGQPYAVEVAPGQYVIHRPEEARSTRRSQRSAAPAVQSVAKAEMKAKPSKQKNVVNTTKYVRHKPKVVETTRYVDLPPRVVERYTVIDDTNGDKKVVVDAPQADAPNAKAGKHDKNQKRVIQADAEITVLGPDRMTIQLYRKGERGKNARIN